MNAISTPALKSMTEYEIRRVLGLDPMGPKPWKLSPDALRDHEDNTAALDAAAEAERDGN